MLINKAIRWCIPPILRVGAFLILMFFLSPGAYSQCTGIDFTTITTSTCAPSFVNFQSVGAPSGSAFTWYFGSNSQSGADTITHFFTQKGNYDIKLEVLLPNQHLCRIEKPNYIIVNQPDSPNLQLDKTRLCNGAELVKLYNTKPGFQRLDWIIEGNNLLNKGDSVNFTYTLPGYKNVSIRAFDNNGCSILKQFDSVLRVFLPIPMNISPNRTEGCKPLKVNYTPTLVVPANRSVVSYSWQFQGGSPSSATTAVPPQVTYTQSGTYSVTLQITMADGCTYSRASTFNIVTVDSTLPDFNSKDTAFCQNTPVFLLNTSDKTKLPGDFYWKFNKGTLVKDTIGPKDTLNLLCDVAGFYNITLEHVFKGCYTAHSKLAYLNAYETQNDFTSKNNVACTVPHTVEFENTSQVVAGKRITWTFYDKTGKKIMDTSNAIHPSYTYKEEGEYIVDLQTVIPGKCKHNVKKAKYVVLKKPKAKVVLEPNSCLGQEVSFLDGTDKFTMDTLKYKWFVWNRDSTDTLKTSTYSKDSYTFKDTGYYDLTFIIYSANGKCADTLRRDSAFYIFKLKAGVLPLNGPYCPGMPVLIKNKANNKPKDLNNGNDWIFWHEQDSSVQVKCFGCQDVIFPKPGRYNLMYIAHNSGFCADTIRLDSFVRVGAAEANVVYDKQTGCFPFSTTVRAPIVSNYHYFKPNDPTIRYKWTLLRDNIKIKPTDSVLAYYTERDSICNLTILKPGVYDVSLHISNTDNCNNFYYTTTAFDLNRNVAFSSPDTGCLGTSVSLQNLSHGNYKSFRWRSNRNSVKFLPSDTSMQVSIQLLDTGQTEIILEGNTADSCVERDTGYIYIKDLDIDFYTDDTLKKCAPALVHFKVKGAPGVLYYWSFGDGDSLQTTGTDIFHVYRQNSGSSSDGFDIDVYAINSVGCESRKSRTDYVKVKGPVPRFDILDSVGCEPYNVRFVDQSQNLSKVFLDFGDGSPFDSAGAKATHIYRIKNPLKNVEVFKPRLLAYDAEQCFSVYEGFDSIIVYRKPVAGFTASKRTGCELESITLNDTSLGAVVYKWDINKDGVIDATVKNPTFVFPPGKHDISLYITSDRGCLDTLSISEFIVVSANPQADFSVGDSEYCFGSRISFFNKSSSSVPIANQQWLLGDQSGWEDTISSTHTFYTFNTPGYKRVQLSVTDSNGCKNTLLRDPVLFILDTVINAQPQIKRVTVNINQSVPVEWTNPPPIRKFRNYLLYRDANGSGWIRVANLINLTDSSWLDQSRLAEDGQVSFKMSMNDWCGTESSFSPVHSSIFNKASSQLHGVNEIKWEPYVGWPVKEYRVYSADANLPADYQLRAVLPATQLQWVDSPLCPRKRFYQVEAVHLNDTSLRSSSNVEEQQPVYEPMVIAPEMRLATVVNNTFVYASWNKPYQRFGQFMIDRFDTLNGWWANFDSSAGNTWKDKQVQVDEYQYTYRVRFMDTCGQQSPASGIAVNILLKARVEEDKPVLEWTAYRNWKQGVGYYLVQIWKNGSFSTVKKVNGSTLAYTDPQLYNEVDTAYTYRVIAVSKDEKDSSISNYAAAILRSRIWIPTAFSPNGDGLNEVFIPIAVGVYNESEISTLQYELLIFNRWGQKVFESRNLFYGWDGTFDGTDCREGVYSYSLRAAGIDKQKITRKGTVTLIR